MREMLPIWVEYAQALAIPAIALAGVCIAAANLWLASKRRQDELFDRRYGFLTEIHNFLSFHSDPNNQGLSSAEYLRETSSIQAKAELLFDGNFAKNIQRIIEGYQRGDWCDEIDPRLLALFRKAMK